MHCNALTMHHNALQCTAMHCNAAMHWQCMAMHCSAYCALGLCTRVPQCTKTIAVHCGAFKLMMHCFALHLNALHTATTMHKNAYTSVPNRHWQCTTMHNNADTSVPTLHAVSMQEESCTCVWSRRGNLQTHMVHCQWLGCICTQSCALVHSRNAS